MKQQPSTFQLVLSQSPVSVLTLHHLTGTTYISRCVWVDVHPDLLQQYRSGVHYRDISKWCRKWSEFTNLPCRLPAVEELWQYYDICEPLLDYNKDTYCIRIRSEVYRDVWQMLWCVHENKRATWQWKYSDWSDQTIRINITPTRDIEKFGLSDKCFSFQLVFEVKT